jgi:Uma2 family endonuclease
MPKPRGKHSKLTGSLIERLLIAIREMGKGDIWTIPRESIVKPYRYKSGYEPGIIVLDEETISAETRSILLTGHCLQPIPNQNIRCPVNGMFVIRIF